MRDRGFGMFFDLLALVISNRIRRIFSIAG